MHLINVILCISYKGLVIVMVLIIMTLKKTEFSMLVQLFLDHKLSVSGGHFCSNIRHLKISDISQIPIMILINSPMLGISHMLKIQRKVKQLSDSPFTAQ